MCLCDVSRCFMGESLSFLNLVLGPSVRVSQDLFSEASSFKNLYVTNDNYCVWKICVKSDLSRGLKDESVSFRQALDYSDDEKEQEAKRKLKNSRKKKDNSSKGV